MVEGGLKAARVALADVKSKMGHGQRVTPQPRLTFGDAAERYMESARATLRPRTVDSYGSHLRTHLLPRWSRRRLDSLTVDDVARLIEEMRAAGKRAWTIRAALVVLGRVFAHARRRLGYSGENPVRLLERSERPASDARDRRILDGEELGRLLAEAEERHRRPFAFAAGTGARLGEVLGLRHTHASAWISSGGDLVELSARLGHANPAITATVYTHEFESARRSGERTARLDAMYGSAMAAPDRSEAQQSPEPQAAEVADLEAKRRRAQ